MNKIVLISLAIMMMLQAGGQEFLSTHRNEVDAQGRKQGLWKGFDGNGNLKYEGNFKDGKPIGEFRYYYPEGGIQAVTMNYDNGRVVYAKTYFKNSKLMAMGKYVDQMKDSTWHYYSEANGSLAAEEIYINTSKEGIWKTFYPSGAVVEEITYKNDQKNGPWVQYFTDGSVKSKGTYIDDELEGLFTVHYLNGKVEVSGTYKHSMKDGIWMYFTDIEEAERKEVYKNGKLVSEEVFILEK